jgi:polyhydroxyalkanoate synthesis regulator protein
MVVEYYIYFLSKIVKFYGDIITIYTGVSNRYNVKIFTIEHNFQKRNRENIYKILNKNGYKRMFKYISFMDDWYIKKS